MDKFYLESNIGIDVVVFSKSVSKRFDCVLAAVVQKSEQKNGLMFVEKRWSSRAFPLSSFEHDRCLYHFLCVLFFSFLFLIIVYVKFRRAGSTGGVLLEGRLHASRVVRRHAKSLVPPASPSSSRVLFPSAPPTTTTPGTATTSADETSDESNGSIEHGTDHVTNSTTTTTSTDATPTSTMSTAMAMHYHGTGTSTPVRSDHDGDDAGAGNTALVHQQQQQNETELTESRLVVSRSAAESAIDVSETSHFVHSAFMNTRIIGPMQQPNASSESPAASNGIGGHASRSLSCRLLSVCHPPFSSPYLSHARSFSPFISLLHCFFLTLYCTPLSGVLLAPVSPIHGIRVMLEGQCASFYF